MAFKSFLTKIQFSFVIAGGNVWILFTHIIIYFFESKLKCSILFLTGRETLRKIFNMHLLKWSFKMAK